MVSTVALFWIWKNVIYFDYWCFLGNGCFENCLLVRFILDDWSFLAKILALLSYRGHAQEESLVFWVFYLEIWDFWSEERWCSIFNWCYQFILSSKWASLLALLLHISRKLYKQLKTNELCYLWIIWCSQFGFMLFEAFLTVNCKTDVFDCYLTSFWRTLISVYVLHCWLHSCFSSIIGAPAHMMELKLTSKEVESDTTSSNVSHSEDEEG
jgi:hypothetical protein